MQRYKLHISLTLDLSASNSSIWLETIAYVLSDPHQDTAQETQEIYVQK